MKLVTIEEMRAIEQEANKSGVSYEKMMEAAGLGVAEVIQSLNIFKPEQTVVGLIGSGNNGGDALVALTSLLFNGWRARAYLVRPRPENDPLLKNLLDAGGEVVGIKDDRDYQVLDDWLIEADVLLDGILGTGITLPLKKEIAQLLEHIKQFGLPEQVVAVDCPSGMDCDSGEVSEACIPADVTITMAAPKMGMLKFPAFNYIGDLNVVGIDLPDGLESWNNVNRIVVDEDYVAVHLPARPIDAHKGTFGTAMIIAGSINYTGAAYLAGKAAYLVGVGLVRMAVAGPLHTVLAGNFPEATWVILPHEMGMIASGASDVVLKNLEKVDTMLIGPGLGTEETTRLFLQKLLLKNGQEITRTNIGFVGRMENIEKEKQFTLPKLVVDADGLRLLNKIPHWHQVIADAVLTPHAGEMAYLTGMSIDEIQNDRMNVALQYAREWGQTVVLKGALTVVAASDGRCGIVPIATAALARAGTGDVLAGLITGLRAQGLPSFEAALTGAWIHGKAGLFAEDNIGSAASVLASDVLESISEVMQLF